MESIDRSKLLNRIKLDEGCVLHAYPDSKGITTLGIGRNIDGDHGGGITLDEALYLAQNDIGRVLIQLSPYPWFKNQDSIRQAALAQLVFNLGIAGLLHFPHFLAAMMVNDYASAVKELVDTPWHSQVGARGDRIISQISTGEWP
jgi:lysozyme